MDTTAASVWEPYYVDHDAHTYGYDHAEGLGNPFPKGVRKRNADEIENIPVSGVEERHWIY